MRLLALESSCNKNASLGDKCRHLADFRPGTELAEAVSEGGVDRLLEVLPEMGATLLHYSTEEIMMRNMLLSTCVMALVSLAVTLSATAQQAPVKAMETVKLTGAAEVPGPGDNDGSGTIKLTFNPDKGEVCYELSVTNIQEATAAHIHEGAAGQDGPVKVGLDAPKAGTAQGCKSADAALVKTIMQNPVQYYVNVHTADFPKGAVRGQLVK